MIALIIARLGRCASDDETVPARPAARPEKWFNDRVPYMITKYRFQDAQGNLWDANTYMQNVRRARKEIDSIHYYRSNWNLLQYNGRKMLESEGSLHPSLLPDHPAYGGWVAPQYGERGPTYFKKMSDLDPANPLGPDNPDLAVFAHAQYMYDYTKTQHRTLLYSIKRADRRYVPGRSDRIGQYFIAEKAEPLPEGWIWSHQLRSSSKMRSLDVLEQYGYDPRSLYKRIGEHGQQNDEKIYDNDAYRQRLLSNARAYLGQFDNISAKTRFYQYTWTTVRTDVSSSADVWYHTPLFDMYSNNQVYMAEYGPLERRRPSLDRMRFLPEKAHGNKVVLVPVSIVRPIDISHSRKEVMMFRTVKEMTPTEQRLYAVPFTMFRPRFTNRDIPGRARQRYKGRGVRFDMRNQETGRPHGHPFTLYPYVPLLPDEDAADSGQEPDAGNDPVHGEHGQVSKDQEAHGVRGEPVQPGVADLLQQAKRKKVWTGAKVRGESSDSVLMNLEQHLNPDSDAFRYAGGTEHAQTGRDTGQLISDVDHYAPLAEKFPHP